MLQTLHKSPVLSQVFPREGAAESSTRRDTIAEASLLPTAAAEQYLVPPGEDVPHRS